MKPDDNQLPDDNPAADLIRQKLQNLYAAEPDVEKEVTQALQQTTPKSKHQTYMHSLAISGKTPTEIEAAWHSYYTALPDEEKHEVWREYNTHKLYGGIGRPESQKTRLSHYRRSYPIVHQPPPEDAPVNRFVGNIEPIKETKPKRSIRKRHETRSVAQIKQQLLSTVSTRQKIKAKRHAQSLIFGLGLSSLVLLILLFGFFNERFIAPFITPSRQVSATPIIVDSNSLAAADGKPKIIIPKINVEIPVVYDVPTIDESAIEIGLERGVTHYATTPMPGEKGNTVIFGHSSNNIFNKGQYKFAFVLLSRMENGDTFYLTKDGKLYSYRVYEKKIVAPSAVEVLGNTDKIASATLITCDPPGTSLNRLVVIGEQVTPDPLTDANSTATPATTQPSIVPSNAPTLWDRLTSWL